MLPFPYLFIGAIAVTAFGRKSKRPSGTSGPSIADQPSTSEGQQDRMGNARPISNRRRRNCARCVSQ